MVLGGIRRGMATTAQLISGLNGWLPFETSSLSPVLHLASLPALSCAVLTSEDPTVRQHLANIMTELLSKAKDRSAFFLARFQAALQDFCGLDGVPLPLAWA